MVTTNVPSLTLTSTGFIAPAESAVLTGVLADLNTAFGGNLNVTNLETPQGQLASSETAIIGDANSQMLGVFNGVDPATAAGRMQDAIARIYFLERNPAEPTVVTAICSGLTGVIIPIGARAVAQDGNQYICAETGTIPSGGTIALTFVCVNTGPIACPIGALATIYQAIPGWDSITNTAAGVEGTNVESRAAFELRRQQSVAANSQGSIPSIRGTVLGIAGVLDAYATENKGGVPLTIGGVTLVPHSLYVAAYGGDPQAIAQAIWTKKSPGCDYNGNTTEIVEDTSAYLVPPYPSYPVTFEIPTPLPIFFAVQMQNNINVPPDAVTQVQDAIVASFNGEDGGSRARIGSLIFALRFVGNIQALGAWAQVVEIGIGFNATAALNYATVGISQIPTLDTSDISVIFA